MPYKFVEKKSKKKALISTTKIRKKEVNIARKLELWILNIFLPNIGKYLNTRIKFIANTFYGYYIISS